MKRESLLLPHAAGVLNGNNYPFCHKGQGIFLSLTETSFGGFVFGSSAAAAKQARTASPCISNLG